MSQKDPVLQALRPGARVFVQGAVGEPLAFARMLAADPDQAAGVEFVQPGIPGINRFDYAGVHQNARLTTFMTPPGLSDPQSARRIRILPLSYGGAAAYLRRQRFDVAVLQVTPPDADGLCAFGVSGDFAPLVWRNARCVTAFINPELPRPAHCETIPFSTITTTVDAPEPLPTAGVSAPSPAVAAAALAASALIDDGAVLQTGVGGVPSAVLDHLLSRKNLVIRSGLVTDGHLALGAAGCLSTLSPHVAGVAWGGRALYGALHASTLIRFAEVGTTHDPAALGANRRFTAVNSALEVDLFGQANVEWRGGRAISGVGGAPEFARAAGISRDGMFIIALPARAGGVSRIVPRLASPSVSLSRDETDIVVTEHGVARLRDLSVEERAHAMIAIAHPDDRLSLGQAFEDLMRSGPSDA